MAITLEASAETQLTGTDTNHDHTLASSGIEADDIILVFVSTQDATDPGAPTTPSGYTQRWSLGHSSSFRPRITCVYKIADGTEEDDVVNFDWGATSLNCHMVSLVYRGIDTTTPFDTGNTGPTTGGASVNPDPASITTVTDGARVLAIVATRDAGGTSTPTISTGYGTEFTQVPDEFAFVITAKDVATAGADNPSAWTWAGLNEHTTVTDVLRPATNVTIDLDLPSETDTAPDVTVTGSGSATIDLDLPVETDTAPDVLAFAPDFNAPVFPNASLGLEVELAFGAGNQSPLDWVWTDVSDRLLRQGISVRRGRSDESGAAQPSTVAVELDNGDGDLTPTNPASQWWPNVRRGTPIRIWVPGDEPALYVPGEQGASASTPDHADFDFAGDIDLRIRLQPDQWSVGIDWASFGSNPVLVQPQRLITKWRALTVEDASFDFSIFNAGWPAFETTPDGLNPDAGGQSTEALVAALRPIWLAVTFEPDNGASGRTVTFYRFDSVTPPASVGDWTVVRTSTITGTTSVFAGDTQVEIGTRDNGTPSFRGRVLAAEFRDGIDGTIVADPDFSAQPAGTRAFTDSTGKEWTINGQAAVTTRRIRFVGTVDEINPTWPFGDHNPTTVGNPSETRAAITASGILRRLSQGAKPLRSALFRHVTSEQYRSDVFAYWPCEDDAGAIEFAPGTQGNPPLALSGLIDAGADDSLLASGPLPTIAAGDTAGWRGPVGVPPFDKKWSVEWAFRLPTPETNPTETVLMVIDSFGTAQRWEFSLSSTIARLRVLDPTGGVLVNSTAGITGEIFTGWVQAVIIAEEQGPSVFWDWTLTNLDIGTGGGAGSSFTGTLGRVTGISNDLTGPPDGLSFGHIIVHRGDFPSDWLAGPDSAWAGESAAHRFHRLCTEEGIPVEIIGDSSAFSSAFGDLELSEPMGPQRQLTLLELLGQCVTTDQGVMISRRAAPGLLYRTRQNLYTQNPALALDAANNEITLPFEPLLDDQRLRNDVTVRTAGGSSARTIDQAHIDDEDLYDEEIEISGVGGLTTQQEVLDNQPGLLAKIRRQNLDQASWRVHLGTWPEMRYPTVTTDLAIADQLIDDWHDVELGDRVTIDNLPIQHPGDSVEVLIEAINERLSPTTWIPTLTCSPGGPWLVGVFDDDTISTDLARLDDDTTTTLNTAITSAATSIPIADANWAPAAGQYPLLIVIDGELIRANSVTTTTTQTFTGCERAVNGVVKAHTAGTTVTVAEPFRLAL